MTGDQGMLVRAHYCTYGCRYPMSTWLLSFPLTVSNGEQIRGNDGLLTTVCASDREERIGQRIATAIAVMGQMRKVQGRERVARRPRHDGLARLLKLGSQRILAKRGKACCDESVMPSCGYRGHRGVYGRACMPRGVGHHICCVKG